MDKPFKTITPLWKEGMVVVQMNNTKKESIRLSKIDVKILKVLKTENKELTISEIANEIGEKPQKIAKSLWKLFLHNDKLLNERLLQIYL